MNPDLQNLPPPPQGQTGITLDQFKHLPPPPQGQQGFTLDQIKGMGNQTTPNVGQRVQGVMDKAGNTIYNQITGQGEYAGQSNINRAVGATATAFGTIPKVAGQFLPEQTRTGLSQLGQKIGQGFNWLTDKISNIKPLQNFMKDVPANNPGEELLGTLSGGGDIAGNILAIGGGVKSLEGGVNKIKGTVSDVKGAMTNKLSGIKVEGQTNKVFEAITPSTKELTPTEYENLLRQQKITPKTPTSPAKYILSDAEKQTAVKYQNLLKASDPVKNSINVMNEIVNKDVQVGNFLRQNNGTFNGGELKNFVADKLKDVTDITVPEARIAKLKDTMINGFIKSLPKNDMETLWKSRKAFDRSIEKVFNGSPTLQNTVKREFRNAIQDFISVRTPEGVYKQSMRDMRELFNLQDTLATKAIKERSASGLKLWFKNNPIKAKVIGGLAGYELLRKTGLVP